MLTSEAQKAVVTEYLAALNYTIDPAKPVMETVAELFTLHVQTFAFFTVDVHLGIKIPILDPVSLTKDLLKHGGGLCFHNNAAFFLVLSSLGDYEVYFASALVRKNDEPTKRLNMPTHVTLIFNDGKDKYLADPGWQGNKLMKLAKQPKDTKDKFSIQAADSPYEYALAELMDNKPTARFEFNDKPVQLHELDSSLEYIYSPEYPFHNLFLCIWAKKDPKTKQETLYEIINDKLIIKTGEKTQKFQRTGAVVPWIQKHFTKNEALINKLENGTFVNPELGRKVRDGISSYLPLLFWGIAATGVAAVTYMTSHSQFPAPKMR